MRILVGPLHEFKILPIYTHIIIFYILLHDTYHTPAPGRAVRHPAHLRLRPGLGTWHCASHHTPHTLTGISGARGVGGMRAARSSASFK